MTKRERYEAMGKEELIRHLEAKDRLISSQVNGILELTLELRELMQQIAGEVEDEPEANEPETFDTLYIGADAADADVPDGEVLNAPGDSYGNGAPRVPRVDISEDTLRHGSVLELKGEIADVSLLTQGFEDTDIKLDKAPDYIAVAINDEAAETSAQGLELVEATSGYRRLELYRVSANAASLTFSKDTGYAIAGFNGQLDEPEKDEKPLKTQGGVKAQGDYLDGVKARAGTLGAALLGRGVLSAVAGGGKMAGQFNTQRIGTYWCQRDRAESYLRSAIDKQIDDALNAGQLWHGHGSPVGYPHWGNTPSSMQNAMNNRQWGRYRDLLFQYAEWLVDIIGGRKVSIEAINEMSMPHKYGANHEGVFRTGQSGGPTLAALGLGIDPAKLLADLVNMFDKPNIYSTILDYQNMLLGSGGRTNPRAVAFLEMLKRIKRHGGKWVVTGFQMHLNQDGRGGVTDFPDNQNGAPWDRLGFKAMLDEVYKINPGGGVSINEIDFNVTHPSKYDASIGQVVLDAVQLIATHPAGEAFRAVRGWEPQDTDNTWLRPGAGNQTPWFEGSPSDRRYHSFVRRDGSFYEARLKPLADWLGVAL